MESGIVVLIGCACVTGVVVLGAVLAVLLVMALRGGRRPPTAPRASQSQRPMANTCLSCGASNPPDRVFCINCGERLYEEIV